MQKFTDKYPANSALTETVHVGVVGSGDLEILLSPASDPHATSVSVRTSVDGFDTVWRRVLDHFFTTNEIACDVEINDFGATPGMVSLRLAQAFEMAAESTADGNTRSVPALRPLPFTELDARSRAEAILDPGTFRELLGPFDHLESTHLEPQGIVPSADDGAVVARGTIDGDDAVVVSLEGVFQGGGIGEVSGAKIAAALERAAVETNAGERFRAVLLIESGGIRLQEANLGLLAIAEIHSAIIDIQRHLPVTAVISGRVGCFGGMGIAASLCDHVVMTRIGRLALNGPEVIETEAGIEEIDSRDRSLIWSMVGGEQRVATGRADVLADDTTDSVRDAVIACDLSTSEDRRPDRVAALRDQLANLSPSSRVTPEELRFISERTN